MVNNNFLIYGLKVFTDLVREILYFPLWWYTGGLYKLAVFLSEFVIEKQKSIGLAVWAKNIFTPMYGQTDMAGKLISFVIRLIQVIFRSAAMLFWLALALLFVIAWVVLPFIVASQIILQLI